MAGLVNYFRSKITVQDLYIFPVKSCKGFKVQSSRYTEEGLEFDRQWMIVERDSHKFLTARTKAKMILIETAIDLMSRTLILTVPGIEEPLRVPIDIPDDVYEDESRTFQDFIIWGGNNEGVIVGNDAQNEALSRYMGVDVLLVRKGRERRLAGPPNYVADLPGLSLDYDDKYELYGDEKTQAVVSWADEMPILIVSQASMDEINRRVHNEYQGVTHFDAEKWKSKEASIVRFRGNIVVNGNRLEPWIEDSWSHVKINNSELYIVQRCARCALPGVDPETAIRDSAVPDEFMKQDRYVWHAGKKLCFGVSAVPKSTQGVIHVGDELKVLGSYTQRDHRGNWVRPEDPEEE